MCGIAGIYDQLGRAVSAGDLERMARTLKHRGPDDEGFFIGGHVGLAFRRLSIIDLVGGHQPMGNEDGTVQVVLNGEIYNYRELATELRGKGHVFATQSDTEVVAHGYEEWGEGVFEHLRGMFGIAIVDTRHDWLLVARDRLGIKPVYWTERGGQFLFASEIKALLAHDGARREPNWRVVGEYLDLRYALGPETFFEGIQSLPPASCLKVTRSGRAARAYWRMPHDRPVIVSMEEAEREVEVALREAVKSHLVSDVPVGLFLSGGVDSTLVLAMMSEAGGGPVRAFTANLGDNETSDVASARRAAEHFGAEHHEIRVKAEEAGLLEALVGYLDQPISDPAILPTYLLSREARKEVTVVLTGEGSDETMGGYRSYLRGAAHARHEVWLGALARIWPVVRHLPLAGQRLGGLMSMVLAGGEAGRWHEMSGDAVMRGMLSGLTRPGAEGVEGKVKDLLVLCDARDPVERLQHLDRLAWMGECTLMKADRMTMAASLEARVPFLDHPLVELAARVSPKLRLLNGETKAVLRRVLRRRHAPVAGRAQQGFVLPVAGWIKQESFREWVSGLLTRENLARRGAVEAGAARAMVEECLATGRQTSRVWRLLCLEIWFRQFMD